MTEENHNHSYSTVKFPIPEHLQCYDYRDSFTRFNTYEIEKWVHDCIEDYPRPNEQTLTSCDEWFYKWFSQFMTSKFYDKFRCNSSQPMINSSKLNKEDNI